MTDVPVPDPASTEDAWRIVNDYLLCGHAYMTADGYHVPHEDVVTDPDGVHAVGRDGTLYLPVQVS